MLSNLLRYAASYLTGSPIEFVSNEEVKETSLDSEKKNNTESVNEIQNSYGKITSFFNNRGLIDDSIYFTQDVIVGSDQPNVGDQVVYKASRSHADGGWIASSVQITALWDVEESKEPSKPYKDVMIGNVVKCYSNGALLKTTQEFDVSLNKFKAGYRPSNGDWVNIELWNKNDENASSTFHVDDIISISPLREKKIHGIVSDILNRHGFINGDVYFSFAICKRGTFFKRGDHVAAIVIESKQIRGNWRAVYIEHKKKPVSSSKDTSKTTVGDDNKRMVCGVNVTNELQFGEVSLSQKYRRTIIIRNKDTNPKTFIDLRTSIQVPGFLLKFNNSHKQRKNNTNTELLSPNMTIYPNETKSLPIEFTPRNLGKISFKVEFNFGDFQIDTKVSANVTDELQQDMTKNVISKATTNAPTFFGKKINTSFADTNNVIPGQRLVRKKKIFLPNKLAQYPIPYYIKECLMNLDGDVEYLVPELSQPLHISNYAKKLSTLLYAEEVHMEKEMREFDLFQVILRRSCDFLTLEVPGLAEGRPSLLLGDRVIVKYAGQRSSPKYEGFIHEIRAAEILLKFNNDFHDSYEHQYVDAQFYFNRTPLRRCHQAIEHALNMDEETIFPKKVEEKEPLVKMTEDKMKFFNLNLNERQKKAVHRILSACGRPTPYVLFGPPGTGKSVTVVESILQVLKNLKHSRVLACAPSNSAADLIAERLHLSGQLNKRDMVRLNAFQRSTVNLPACIEPYCTNDTDDLQFVSRHRVIITTCNMAGFLYSFDMKVGHFTHVFVDEAGQATEPECMIPVGFAAGSEESQIVLAGDPYQLGPVLRSGIAQDYGLNISFLERLCNSVLYQRNEDEFKDLGSYNPLLVTKLVNNYRSHQKLLQLPSSLFYHHELVPCAEDSLVNTFVGCKLLPNSKAPFIFHGIRGEDFREGNSPSWFNPAEAVQVVKYVQTVIRLYPNKIDDADIGIITPYRKQVEKIRVLLDKFDLSEIKVGSVEEFQGQERKFIIISTVRSNEDLVDSDCHHNIGFLSNPKRFNVSVTRAQSLMIIVGNPVVLCYDVFWCAMLQYAVLNDCYLGCDLPSLESQIVKENFQQALVMLGANTTTTEVTYDENDDSVCDVLTSELEIVNHSHENGARENRIQRETDTCLANKGIGTCSGVKLSEELELGKCDMAREESVFQGETDKYDKMTKNDTEFIVDEPTGTLDSSFSDKQRNRIDILPESEDLKIDPSTEILLDVSQNQKMEDLHKIAQDVCTKVDSKETSSRTNGCSDEARAIQCSQPKRTNALLESLGRKT